MEADFTGDRINCYLKAVIFDQDYLALRARPVNYNLEQVVQDELETLMVCYDSEIIIMFTTVY